MARMQHQEQGNTDSLSVAETNLQKIFRTQRAEFTAHPFPSADQRKADLRALKTLLQRYQNKLAEALNKDFGYRAPAESIMLDVMPSVMEINHCLAKLAKWMRPSRRFTELLFLSNSLSVRYQPKGVVGIIVPWNFPVYLAIGPLAVALAAGNRVMIKMSEVTPHTNKIMRTMLAEQFPASQIAVFGEEVENPNDFTSLGFDHLIFTGSPAVGRKVMQVAAETLTPVTLELGGKSPALILPDYDLAEAAKRIAHGKATNCGQICVSPDYALVPKNDVERFAESLTSAYAKIYSPEPANNPDYTSVINDRHFQRLQSLIKDAEAKGAKIIRCGETKERRMALHIVTQVTPDMRVMQEEIFGPILPIMGYDTPEQAVSYIQSHPRPLALYLFTHNARQREELLTSTHAGGVTINDWCWHVINHDAPFGGIGNSGMGSYHGIEGFRELSHAKTIFKRHRFFPIALFYPPYGNFAQKLTLRLWLGKADPNL